MRALIKKSMIDDNLYLEEIPERVPGEHEVKIRIMTAGICGTDLHIRKGGGMNITTPVVLGHEFCGEIVEAGSGVQRWKPGDRVTAEPPARTCGTCEYCLRLMPALCSERQSIGSGVDGAFAEYLTVSDARLHAVPADIDVVDAALLEPLACCVHAVLEKAAVRAGDEVLVIGPGPMGLLIGQLAKVSGARVAMLGTPSDSERLELAGELGIDAAVIAGEGLQQDALTLEDLKDWTFDTVFECSGSAAGVKTALDQVKKLGSVIQIGLMQPLREIDLVQIVKKELNYCGSFGSTHWSWEKAITLLHRGTVRTRPLVTKVLPLDQWELGFTMMETKEACKVILVP
jgi:L-iditol 2-dehydrogenase